MTEKKKRLGRAGQGGDLSGGKECRLKLEAGKRRKNKKAKNKEGGYIRCRKGTYNEHLSLRSQIWGGNSEGKVGKRDRTRGNTIRRLLLEEVGNLKDLTVDHV